jgi:ubiquinone/menaquinone biosynthesis C-methylase UbiE
LRQDVKRGIVIVVDDTQRYYERHAQEYAERTRLLDKYPGFVTELGRFADMVPRGGTVVDLGSGSGRDSLFFAAQGLKPLLIDNAPSLLRQAAKYVGDSATSVLADLRALPLGDQSVGGVWASGSLLHLSRSDISVGLTEIRRILRADGAFGICMRLGLGEETCEDGRPFTYVSIEEIRDKCSFSNLKIEHELGPNRGNWLTVLGRPS